MLELDGRLVGTRGELLCALGGSSVEEAAAQVGAHGHQVVLALDTLQRLGTLDDCSPAR